MSPDVPMSCEADESSMFSRSAHDFATGVADVLAAGAADVTASCCAEDVPMSWGVGTSPICKSSDVSDGTGTSRPEMFPVEVFATGGECAMGGGCTMGMRFGVGPGMCFGVVPGTGGFAGGTLYLERGMFGNVRNVLIVVAACNLTWISCILICMFNSVR